MTNHRFHLSDKHALIAECAQGTSPGHFETAQTKPIRLNCHPFNNFVLIGTPAAFLRRGQEDLMGCIVFLAPSASDFAIEQIIDVDRGILAAIGKPVNEF